MEHLETAESGVVVADLVKMFGGTSGTNSKVVQRLYKYGHVARVSDPGRNEPLRQRYFLEKHRETALQAVGMDVQKPKPAEKPAEKWVGQVTPSRHQVWKQREPEPFFASMGPGRYVETDSWAARAFGG